MDDVIKLISTTYEADEYGNPVAVERKRKVFCAVSSVGRSEFYQAAQSDMHPEYIFTISHFKDYRGEKFVEYTDWMDVTHRLYVTRAYRVPDADQVELTCEERTGMSHGKDDGSSCRCD